MFQPGAGAAATTLAAAAAAAATVRAAAATRLRAESLPGRRGARRALSRQTAPIRTARSYRGMAALTPDGNRIGFTWWIGAAGLHRRRRVRRPHAGGELGRQQPGDLHRRSQRQSRRRMGRRQRRPSGSTLYRARGRTADGARRRASIGVAGQNPNGSRYRGARRHCAARRPATTSTGRSARRPIAAPARCDGNILVVDWGSATPVVYALGADGSLRGLWDAGRAEEVLTPAR